MLHGRSLVFWEIKGIFDKVILISALFRYHLPIFYIAYTTFAKTVRKPVDIGLSMKTNTDKEI